VKKATTSPVRCAIYTRVSTEHGLEQDFNSLDAQRDAAQAYIRSQAHAGFNLKKKGLKGRAVERCPGKRPVVIAVGNEAPTLVSLALDIGR